jgi:hypothetical protein
MHYIYLKGGVFMDNQVNVITSVGILGYIDSILKLFMYIATICVLFKIIQVLNVYINKNNRL